MKFLYSLSGTNVPVIKDFEIEKTTKIYEGKVVRCDAYGTVSHEGTGNCIGVAAETHTGEKDLLNARNDGTKVRIDVTVGGVYEVPAIRLYAGADTEILGEFNCPAGGLEADIADCSVMLLSKGENSENTDSVGDVRKIISCTITDGIAKIKTDAETFISEGDVYAFLPTHCFKGYLAADGESFTCVSGSGINLTVVSCNRKNATMEVYLGSKQFNR